MTPAEKIELIVKLNDTLAILNDHHKLAGTKYAHQIEDKIFSITERTKRVTDSLIEDICQAKKEAESV